MGRERCVGAVEGREGLKEDKERYVCTTVAVRSLTARSWASLFIVSRVFERMVENIKHRGSNSATVNYRQAEHDKEAETRG